MFSNCDGKDLLTMAVPRSILVTGGNRGIGLEFVRQLLAVEPSPDFVIATHRSPRGSESLSVLESLARDHKNLHLFQLDVTDEAALKQMADSVDSLVGETGLNLMVNNSGINTSAARHMDLTNITSEALMEHLSVNSIAPVMLCKTMLPALRRAADRGVSLPVGWQRAAVVHITSLMASIQLTGEGEFQAVTNTHRRAYAYRGSKTAANMYARIMSYELLPLGVGSLILHPGWVKTDMGGPSAQVDLDVSVSGMIEQIRKLDESRNGEFLDYKGSVLPW